MNINKIWGRKRALGIYRSATTKLYIFGVNAIDIRQMFLVLAESDRRKVRHQRASAERRRLIEKNNRS